MTLADFGFLAMKDALKILGYDGVYHMESIIRNPPDANMWKRAVNAKYYGKGKPLTREEWDQLLGQTQVANPFPQHFYSSLLPLL
jgi:hypothetical protein